MTKWSDKERAIRSLEKKGAVDPWELIEEARDQNHPCHEDFTWDVKEAAKKCWHEEAKRLIRTCQCQIMVDGKAQQSVVEYVPSPDLKDPRFVSLPKVRSKSKIRFDMVLHHGTIGSLAGVAAG